MARELSLFLRENLKFCHSFDRIILYYDNGQKQITRMLNSVLATECIIFYATISAKEVNKDFDTSAIDSLTFSKIKSDLFPVLAVKDKFDLEGKKQQAKEYIASLMKPTEAEMEYMERFIEKEYKPELLFEDAEIIERLRDHPMALVVLHSWVSLLFPCFQVSFKKGTNRIIC